MKILLLTILFYILYSCNQPTSSNQNVNRHSQTVSVFETSDNENPDNLKHIKEELVAPPFLPKYQQAVSGDPVVVEIILTVEEKMLEIAPGVNIWT